ncbi:MAG TPA: formimidoylglutamase [Bacteroidales bacterium]|nr:formimidoylglutamase [Bacteroidales bacterium]HSA43997.1 formimidoylglutamase [Bacteroidales bacterium]
MDLSLYFEPIELFQFRYADANQRKRLGDVISSYLVEGSFPLTDGMDIAFIGVKEDRSAVNNPGCSLAPDMIRDYLYMLFPGSNNPRIIDLGNIKQGYDVEDTYFALSTVITELLREGIVPVILGGSQDLTWANYRAYEDLGQIINLVSVDSCFDLGKTDTDCHSQSYLSRIILHQPNYLFNYANIGYQTYFVDQEAIALMKNLLFDTYRLGIVRTNIEEVEPIVRNADMVSIDISAVRHSDAPGNGNASPHGFYGEEMCQIVRYAGLSDKLTSIGFYEVNPSFDHNGQTTHLVAQMIWYFIDGFYNRKNDLPLSDKENYIKYMVSISGHKDEMIFYKSKKSDRWWMEVPVQTSMKNKYQRHYLVPCSYQDYQTACKDDIPNRWWQVYQKLM